MATLNALLFDVFGTLVDWRSSIAREARGDPRPAWRRRRLARIRGRLARQYQPAMDEVRSGRLPFCKLDALHRRNLDVSCRASRSTASTRRRACT